MGARREEVFEKSLETFGFCLEAPVIVGFGEFVLDGCRRQLLRGDEPVHLSPKAFELLSVLVVERPRAISKVELHDRIWKATFVSESTLATLIAEIRTALGDQARAPRFVRTSYGFGYAFCGAANDIPEPDYPLSAGMSYWVITDNGQVSLSDGENVIGRDPAATVLLDLPTVSRRHARILIAAHGATLEDLGSRNGTFMGKERITSSRKLSDGDQIRVGSVIVRFKAWNSARPIETESLGDRQP